MPQKFDRELWAKPRKEQLLSELWQAYRDARTGKRQKIDEHKFEIREFTNIINLRDAVWSKNYRPSRGTVHIIRDPKVREIFAAPFVDRIIHHWLYNNCASWWDKRFIDKSFSCREGKGTLAGILALRKDIQRVSHNYRDDPYVVKLDLASYFTSIDRKIALNLVLKGLRKQFEDHYDWKYELLEFCWKQVLLDDPCAGVHRKGWPEDWRDLPKQKSLFNQKAGVGLVIGNLTSQLVSNIVLNELDRFVTFDLGVKAYGRYVDDFYMVIPKSDKAKIQEYIERIADFLKTLGLTLHPAKRYIQPASHGVEFLGARIFMGFIYPGKRIIRNMKRAFYEVEIGERSLDSVASYLGLVSHMKSKKLVKEIFDDLGWRY